MKLRHALEDAELRTAWRQRNTDRKAAMGLLRAPDVQRHFDAAARNNPIVERSDGDKAPTPDAAREKHIRETTGKGLEDRLSREQDNDPDHGRDR